MGLNYNTQSQTPDFETTVESVKQSIIYNDLNCCRIGIVQAYDPTNRIAKVLIANKLVKSINEDGSQNTVNYAPIYAKVLFFGWGGAGITHPIIEAEKREDGKGTEGILLFCDREIESWYVNGNINNLKYNRAHHKTDAIFIPGIFSLPNMISAVNDCINIYYGNKNIKINGGGTVITGSLQADGITDTQGATGSIVDSQGKTLANVKNGIVTEIF